MRAALLIVVMTILAVPAFAQSGGGSSSMPGTAGVNPGSISRETVGTTPSKDTSNAGTAGQYTGSTNSGTGSSSLGTNPMSGSPINGPSSNGAGRQ